MRKILIVSAMIEELQAFLDYFNVSLDKYKFAKKNVVFNNKNYELLFCVCGIGKVNSSTIVSYILAENKDIDLVINIGSAAGIHKKINILDIVIGTELNYFDVDITSFGYKLGQVAMMPEKYLINNDTKEKVEKFLEKNKYSNIHQGLIISGDSFVNSDKKIAEIRNNFSNALILDMESCAIAQSCFLICDTKFLAIRGVTDKADSNSKKNHSENLEVLSKKVQKFVVKFIFSI